ncbi:MAG: DUF421 domain-containing protein [Chloroflexota bacterium]|nr:DUF421 domain-containing protein [Chloroflexota bacterium]
MDWLWGTEWRKLLLPDTPLLEIFLRGSIMYLSLYFVLRIVLRREAGGMGIADLLVVVLIADAAQNAMANDYSSLSDGLLLVGTIVFWSHAVNWLGYRFPSMERWVRPQALPLVLDGRMLPHNMRRELITEGELLSQLRLQGVDDVADVKEAYMEGDGRISVVARERDTNWAPDRALV